MYIEKLFIGSFIVNKLLLSLNLVNNLREGGDYFLFKNNLYIKCVI